ncbi:MAG: hypothetical protein K8U03_02590 [Planctomycetia bacterium]|nr:hypothetical protein [Planctomycetia bacterium]
MKKTQPLSLLAALGLVAVFCGGCNKSTSSDPSPNLETVALMRKSEAAGGGAAAGGGGGSGWGTLKGSFKFAAAAPNMADIAMGGKDPMCKIQVKDESIRVDPATKGLADVLIFLVEAPRVTPDYDSAPQKEAVFDQTECRFIHHVFASSIKDKFVILNSDTTGHNSNGSPGRGNPSYNVLLAAKTGRYEYAGFKNPLTTPYEVSCAIHPWMKAYHVVRPDPYFAVTGKDGTFAIEKLPAGVELEFQVWHEKGTATGNGLKAKPEWSNRGRFKVTIPKDGETVAMDVEVPQGALQ